MSRDRLARIERIERLIAAPLLADVPLTRAELAELRHLERDRAERFPGPIDQWSAEMLDDFMSYQCGEGGAAQRLDHLRQRTRSPEEIGEHRAMDIAVAAMDQDELDDFAAAMGSGTVGDHPWRP